jgi:uncharacterized repeat protein (TIGR01451 family)
MGKLRMRSWIAAGARVALFATAGFAVAVMLGGGAAGALLTTSESTGTDTGTTTEATTSEATTSEATTTVTTEAAASTTLSLDKTGPESATAGTRIDYEIAVENTGEVEATGVQVMDFIPAGAADLEFDHELCELTEGGTVLACDIGAIPVEAHRHVDLSFVVGEPGSVTNRAQVVAGNVDGALEDSVTTEVEEPTADLEISKSAPANAAVGDEFEYVLQVDNRGQTSMTGVTVTDPLPAGVTFRAATGDGTCSDNEGTIECSLGTMAADDSRTVRLGVTAATAGTKVNTASVASAVEENGEAPNSDTATTSVAAESTGERALIFGPTDSAALRQAVTDAGFEPVVASAAEWGSMTTADFDNYRALLIGDPGCSSVSTVAAAVANKAVWGAAVNGNVIIDGTDPVLHSKSFFTQGAVRFATARGGRTGAYVSLSCYYTSAGAGTPVPLLDAFHPGGFTVNSVSGCFDAAHIVADHPALAGITDSLLSGWGCSVHEAFDAWPDDFLVLAIALSGTVYHANDGTVGTPYILARGEGLSVISNITTESSETPTAPGTPRIVTARVVEDSVPQPGKVVRFRVVSGPNAGTEGFGTTDLTGTAVFSYTGTSAGTDAIEASYVDSTGATQTSNRLFVTWEGSAAPPSPPSAPTTDEGTTTTTTTTTTSTVAKPPPPPPPAQPGTFNGQTTAGIVLLNGRPIDGTVEIHSGDVIDATNGTIEIVSDSGRAEFFGGAFRITQGPNGITRLELVGGDFSICAAPRAQALRAGDGKPVRRLWGKGTGKFQTKARYSSATVRGTEWLTEDQCDGSLIATAEGTVDVFDFSLRRTLSLPSGREYFAQVPPPPSPGKFVGDPTGQVLVNGQPLEQDGQIRNGDTVDVRQGSIQLTTTSGKASFYSGIFTVRQTGGSSSYTELTLVGGDFSACGQRRLAAKDPPKKNVRSLWGKGTGKFRTKSRFSSATVRGTNWLSLDRCDGSLTVVREGIVEVFDFTLRKTVQVGAGEQYLAPAKK